MKDKDKKTTTHSSKQKLTKNQNETEEIKNLLMRVQADFDNYRKRTQKEKEEFGQYLNTDLVLRILPALDNFRLALKHLPKELENNHWVKGVWQIEKQLEQTLSEEGLAEIPVIGKNFDPNIHEAVEEVESNLPKGTITEEITRGYRLKDKIIRYAKVKVSKGSNKNNN